MTSVEIPYSVAAALPTLAALDITNDVAHEVALAGCDSGIAYVSAAAERSLVRVQERETGFFCDFEDMLTRIVPLEMADRERVVIFLLGGRTEQIPVADGRLCLGTYQRVLLFGFGTPFTGDWRLTLVA